jgi:hypothetical protein
MAASLFVVASALTDGTGRLSRNHVVEQASRLFLTITIIRSIGLDGTRCNNQLMTLSRPDGDRRDACLTRDCPPSVGIQLLRSGFRQAGGE